MNTKIIHTFKQTILFSLLISSYGFLNYNYFGGWYDSSIGTAVIILISYFIWRKDFLSSIGLNLDLKKVIKTFLILGLLILACLTIVKYIATKNNIKILLINWTNYYHIFFYTLNEEIIMGALPLLVFVKRKNISPIYASIGLAVFFSIIHFVFYKWIFLDRGNIKFITLTTLFFVGIVRNELILRTRHIGYSWALHCSWIVLMFGTYHYYTETESGLSELIRFNTYLGSYEMLIVATFLVSVVIVGWCRTIYYKKTKENK